MANNLNDPRCTPVQIDPINPQDPEVDVELLKREKMVDGVRKFEAAQERLAARNVRNPPEAPPKPRG